MKRVYLLYLIGLLMTTFMGIPTVLLGTVGAIKTVFFMAFICGLFFALIKKSETAQMFAIFFLSSSLGVATALGVKGDVNGAVMLGVAFTTAFLGVVPKHLVHLSRVNMRKEYNPLFTPDKPFTISQVLVYAFAQFAIVAIACAPHVLTFSVVAFCGLLLVLYVGERALSRMRPRSKKKRENIISSCPACLGRGDVHHHAA